jgi:hypothetical protein
MSKTTPVRLNRTTQLLTPVDYRILRRRQITDDGCWNYLGKHNPNGYAAMSVGSTQDGTQRDEYVHRLAYELWVGPIPSGLQIDHLCRNKGCFNPEHLEPVTHTENQRRRLDYITASCRDGHEHTPENTWITSSGKKRCRICKRALNAKNWAARKAAA